MAKGSNDLNALLKAKVVQIRAELDVKGSMPKIRKQVDEISKLLENKPVKLKARFDISIKDLNKQLSALTTKIHQSKTAKTPIKLKVQIDVKGSAEAIKKQLGEVGRVVDDFNKKFSKQINMLGELNKKLNEQQRKTSQSFKTSPNSTAVGGFNTKKYLLQLSEVETEMRRVFGNKGNFSSFEFKDAEGNLQGFIAQLEKANGVIDKVRYNFNAQKGSFELVDQQTITNQQKALEKAVDTLQKAKREIDKLGRTDQIKIKFGIQGRGEFQKEYNQMMKDAQNGNLTIKDVEALNAKIKKEKDLVDIYKAQRQLVSDIAKTRAKESRQGVNDEYRGLLGRVQNAKNSLKDIQNLRTEYERLAGSTKKYNDRQSESQQVDIKRQKMLTQFNQIMSQSTRSNGLFSESEAKKTRAIIAGMNSQKTYIEMQQKMARMNKQLKADQLAESQRVAINKLQQTVTKWGIAMGKTEDQVSRAFEHLKRKAGDSIGGIEKQIKYLERAITNGRLTRELKAQTQSMVKHINGMTNQQFKSLIDSRDINKLKEYVGALNQGSVSTMKLVTDSKGLTRIVATMESAGKTARQFSYEIDNVNRQLRQTGTSDVFNANRNLGLMEQLRIAMARVPVWMTSMTAFYGSLRAVQSAMREIVAVDKLMTDINRVASDSTNMDVMFAGAVNLSKELGNNLHDILTSLGEFARTFGDFNERQLLAITKTATIMSNVSELTAQEATESLVGTMNAFNIEASESIRIVDALNEVDNNYAISTKQLAEGLGKSASTAVTFGSTMEETIGHITAIGSVTMESGKQIGNGLKTIYSRITTLESAESILNSVGVSIYKIGENGEKVVKPVNTILGDLAEKWHTLSDSQRQNIGVQVAGRYQLTRFLALMNNYKTALDSTQTATYSQGSAMRENAKYMESFEARLNQLKNSFSALSLAVGDALLSDAMLGGIEALRELAEMAVWASDKIGILAPIALSLFLIFRKSAFVDRMVDNVVSGLTSMQTTFVQARASATGFGATMSASMTTAGAGMTGLVTRARAMATGVTTSFASMITAVRTFSVAFKSVLASTGIGLLFVGIGIAIEKIVSHFSKAKQKAEDLKAQNDKLIASYHELGNSQGVNEMVSRYDELRKTTKRTAEEQEELDRITKTLAEKFPTMVDHIDAQGNAHLLTTDALRKQVEMTEELSKAQARVEAEKFDENISKQATSYQKLQKELDKIIKQGDRLEKQHGKMQTVYQGYGMGTSSYKIDNSDAMAENNMERVLKQAEMTEAIQQTINVVQKASLAYQEQSGKLGLLGDSQQKVIENVIGMNHEYLRLNDVSTESQNKLFELGNAVGDVFARSKERMEDAVKNMNLAPDEEINKLNEIEQKFGEIAKAIPEDMFKLDKNGNLNTTITEFEKMMDIVEDIDSATDFTSLQQQLINVGVDADHAGQFIANLAVEQQNSVLKSQAQREGYEGVSESLDVMAEKAMEALDLMKEIFGYSGTELEAMESYLDAMHLMVDIQGEGAKTTDAYIEKQQFLADFLGVTTEELEKNKGAYEAIILGLQELDLTTYDASMSWEKFIDKQENLDEKTKNLLKTFDGAKDIITGQKTATEELATTTDELATSQDNAKVKSEELKTKFEELKATQNDTTESAWLGTVRGQLEALGGKIQITKDEAGNFKFAMADGSASPYLDTLHQQMSDLGYELSVTKDDVGNLVLAFTNDQGSQVLYNLQGDLQDSQFEIDNTKVKMDELNQKEVKPEIDVDFEQLKGGLGEVDSALGGLDEAFKKLKDNIKKLGDLKGLISEVKGMFERLKDSMEGLFSNSKGDFENLEKKAKDAKKAVDNLKTSMDKIKNLASRVDVGGIEDLISKSETASTKIGKLGDKLKTFSSKMDGMSGDVKSATSKMNDAIDKQKKAIDKLGDAYEDAKDDVRKDMESMKDRVVSSTNKMIDKHKSQADAIDDLASSARNARTAILRLNSSAQNAMDDLDRYITRANRARSVGNSVPNPSGLFGLFGVGGSSSEGVSEGVASAMSTFSASAEGATGGGGGTSGTIQPSTYYGGVNSDGGYLFSAFAGKKEQIDKAIRPDYDERKITVWNGIIAQIETRMQRMTKNTVEYRDAIKDVLLYQNKVLQTSQEELKATEKRNSEVNKRLKQLGKNINKHTKAERDEWNKLQQEYDANLNKIATLKNNVESLTNEIKAQSEAIFSDFIDEIVGKYEKAIEGLKDKTDNIDFKLDVLSLTDPDDLKKQLSLLAEKSNVQQEERNTLANQKDTLETQYNDAVKKYGKNSEQAKKVKAELKAVEEAWEDATIAVLQTEKQIKDVRGKVADDSIKQLKDYYKNMKDMAVEAIEAEKKALEESHKKKMEQYDEQTKAINAVYDAQFKKMDEEKSQAEYQEQLDEKNTKKAELLNKISLLSRDNSLEGRKKLEELKKELATAEKDISDFMKARQEELLRQELETQKQAQLEKIEAEKADEQTSHDNAIAKLDEEKEKVTTEYDNILNDEKLWATKREEFIKGSFSNLKTELQDMSNQLAEMNRGNFDLLTDSFSTFSEEVKQKIKEMNALTVDNMIFGLTPVIGDVNEVYDATQPKNVKTGTKVTIPKMNTTTAKPKQTASQTKQKPDGATPKPNDNTNSQRFYTVKKGDTLWDIAKAYYGTGTEWKKIAEANGGLDPRKLQIGRKLLIPFDTGGYTGEWAGNEGKVALLHKKEVVLNQRQTRDILDTAKIMDKLKGYIPKLKRNNISDVVKGGVNVTNNYELTVQIERLNGDKEGANTVVKEIMKGLKKLGK